MENLPEKWKIVCALVALVLAQSVDCGDVPDETFHARDCSDHKAHGEWKNGVYFIYPSNYKWTVFCEGMNTPDVTAWTVIQRRRDGTVNFTRTWPEYRRGFGYRDRDHWVGNDIIHDMTSSADRKYVLRVDIETWDMPSVRRHADYSQFRIGTETQKYKLHYKAYSGNAGDSLQFQRGMGFSTPDQDNDAWELGSCAAMLRSGWWFNDCGSANLNGQFYKGLTMPGSPIRTGIWWFGMGDMHDSFRCTMKIRPISEKAMGVQPMVHYSKRWKPNPRFMAVQAEESVLDYN